MDKELTAEQQQTWDTLRGFSDHMLKHYAEKKPGKFKQYMRIQKLLYKPEVAFTPVKAERRGPGGCNENWYFGLQELAEYLPRRKQVVPKALKEIEEAFSNQGVSIKWGKMTWIFKYTYTRYGSDVNLGADMLIEGKTEDGTSVNYYYDNTNNSESAYRAMVVKGKKFVFSEMKKAIKHCIGED